MPSSPIVARINSLLAEKGISKKTFYRECGISSASYSLWNTGKTKPRMKNLEVIAKFLNVPVSYLVDGETIYLLNKAVPFSPHLSIDDIVINSGAEIEQKENPATESSEAIGISDEDLKHLAAFHAADEDTKKAIRLLLAKFEKEVN